MLKKSGLIFLLAHGMAAMAQTVSGNVFCAGMSFDPAPASVSISGTVAASDVGLPGAIWVGIEDPGTPGTPAAFLTPSGWVTWTTGGFPTYVETTAIGSTFSYSSCIPSSPAVGANSAEMLPPAENRPICAWLKSNSARSVTLMDLPLNMMVLPAERLLARG